MLFSPALDRDPAVRVWLSGLSDRDRRKLRDDITHRWKEFPRDPPILEGVPHVEQQDEPGLDFEALDELRAVLVEVATAMLPTWKAKAFGAWVERKSPTSIARDLGVSRASVRAALDGQHHRGDPGAIEALVVALSHDEEFIQMATKKVKEASAPKSDRWFRGIARKPELFAAWSLLLVLDDMADARREVSLNDLLGVVPRAVITPLLHQLKAHGMAASDGRRVKIHRIPTEE